MKEPRGIRCNNPLNIEHSPRNQWQGLDDPPSDGRFARFTEPQWGLRAALTVLRNYRKRGIVTLRQAINAWAPSHENDTESYLGFVVRKSGVRAEQPLPLDDKAAMIRVLKAMVEMENGRPPPGTANGNWLDDAVYEAAWSLSKPMQQSRTIVGSATAAGATAAQGLLDVAQESLQQGSDAALVVGSVWPEIARWVLIAVALAGIGYAMYARWEARREGVR